jgi:hypothetical protein
MIGDLSGHSPPNPPRQNPSGAQQRTNTKQPDTDQAPPPSVIKILPAEQTQQKPPADEQKGPEKPSNSLTLSDKIAALASIVALLQFFALVGTVCVLIWTAKRQLRAYVFPIEAVLKKLYIGEITEYRVVIKNTGQTPAYKLRHIDRFAFVDFPLKEPLPEAIITSENFTRTHLGPGGTLEKSGAAHRPDGTPVPLTDGALKKIKDGKAAIYTYGKIDFVDAFKRERWVKYRYMIGGNVGFQSDGKLIICEQGNETSED